MTKVSIIVPAYNSENTIAHCLDSIAKQTFRDWECIVVNDGSRDNTSSICHRIVRLDKRFKILDKTNEGVSSARNDGVKLSKGEWITFIDSDDYVEPTYIESFIRNSHDTDFVLSSSYTIESEKGYTYKLDKIPFHGNLFKSAKMLRKLYFRGYTNMPWGKLFKSNIILDNHLKFDSRYQYGEDIFFTLDYLINVKKITISDIKGYHYVIYPDGLARKKYPIDEILEWNNILLEKYKRIRSVFQEPHYIDDIIEDNYTYYTFYLQHNILVSNFSYMQKLRELRRIYSRYRNKIKLVKLRNSSKKSYINIVLYKLDCPEITIFLGKILKL